MHVSFYKMNMLYKTTNPPIPNLFFQSKPLKVFIYISYIYSETFTAIIAIHESVLNC